MRKGETVDSGSDEETSGGDASVRSDGASAYEKQRLSRMAENRARMEALGLHKLASSLMKPTGSPESQSPRSKKSKGKRVKVDDDDDFRPEDERPVSSSSDEDEKEKEEDDNNGNRKSSSKRKVKKKAVANPKKIAPARKFSSSSGYIDDDAALKMAIALSLRESGLSETSDMNMIDVNERKGNYQSQENSGKSKSRKPFASRVQMTEDELLLHFYQFDENWNDGISVRDLGRVAAEHDFTWTDKELADMIRCFDSDGDGKLSVDDFRKIAVRCKMIKGCERP